MRASQRLHHGVDQAVAHDAALVRLAHHHAADEDEALGGGDVEAVAAGHGVQPRVATEMVHHHGEDAEATQEVDAQVAVAAALGARRVGERVEPGSEGVPDAALGPDRG